MYLFSIEARKATLMSRHDPVTISGEHGLAFHYNRHSLMTSIDCDGSADQPNGVGMDIPRFAFTTNTTIKGRTLLIFLMTLFDRAMTLGFLRKDRMARRMEFWLYPMGRSPDSLCSVPFFCCDTFMWIVGAQGTI